MEKEENS